MKNMINELSKKYLSKRLKNSSISKIVDELLQMNFTTEEINMFFDINYEDNNKQTKKEVMKQITKKLYDTGMVYDSSEREMEQQAK